MQPGDPLIGKYNLEKLAGEAVRESEARQMFKRLEELFYSDFVESLAFDAELHNLPFRLVNFIGSYTGPALLGCMSVAYESLHHDEEECQGATLEGVELVTRIVNLRCPQGQPGTCGADIYMIGQMGREQKSITINNCRYGLFATENGDLITFVLDENPNHGLFTPTESTTNSEGEAIAVTGFVDTQEVTIRQATADEPHLILREFQKAIAYTQKMERQDNGQSFDLNEWPEDMVDGQVEIGSETEQLPTIAEAKFERSMGWAALKQVTHCSWIKSSEKFIDLPVPR